jgi:hypothetical protein
MNYLQLYECTHYISSTNKYGSVTVSNQVQHIIGQKFFLKSDINFIRQFFYQTEFEPTSKRLFETSEAIMRILMLFIRHVISK